MVTYQIHRLKTHLRQQFRFAPHVSGVSSVKPRDYQPGGSVEAASPYAAFFALRNTPEALEVGDVLESTGGLRILKFVGFDEAQWVISEAKPPVSAGDASSTASTHTALQ